MIRETASAPAVYLLGRTVPDELGMAAFAHDQGGENWWNNAVNRPGHPPRQLDAQDLVEAAGRTCYRSWEPGLNPNVTRVRTDPEKYHANVIRQEHFSVMEHASYTFGFSGVSRVFTHELITHRHASKSQESMRFVRLTGSGGMPFWFPSWAQDDLALYDRCQDVLATLNAHQEWMAAHFGLDEPRVSFDEKKQKTSFMRRFAPDGVSTVIVWTANISTLRYVIQKRTSLSAEEEIRLVFSRVAHIMQHEAPMLFQDFEENAHGEWVSSHQG